MVKYNTGSTDSRPTVVLQKLRCDILTDDGRFRTF